MKNVRIKEFKINIGKKDYTFRLDFLALIKFEEKFGVEGIQLFNEFLQGKNVYGNIVKILSCACVEKDFTENQLAKGLSFDVKTMQIVDEITYALVAGIMDDSLVAKEDVVEGNDEKN